MLCEYCEVPKRKITRLNIIKRQRKWNLNYQIKIGKTWHGQQFKNTRLILSDHGATVASYKIAYCPFCGRKL